MKANKRVSTLLFAALLVISLSGFTMKAGVVREWSPDMHIPGYLDDTSTPFLLTDRHGIVHAFVSQWVGNGYRHNAVVYRQWTPLGGWTRLVDIILAPTGDALFLGAFLDKSDTMHLIFMAGKVGNYVLYYSFVPLADADLATAWSLPAPVGDAIDLNSAVIAGDDKGNLFIIYGGNRDGNGIYFVTSDNGGESWSDPIPIFLTYDNKLVPYSLRLVMGQNDQLRATWNVVTSLGSDDALYFSNYNVGTSKWSTPIELDHRSATKDSFGPSFPAMVDNGQNIIIMYNSGNPFPGRPVGLGLPVQQVRLSNDDGQNWSGPSVPFPFHLGRSGEHALVLDGSGTPHALFIQRVENTTDDGKYSVVGGIWHSAFKDGNWTNPERLVSTYTPHDLRAVVSQGNILLTVWREDPGAGQHGIWFSYTVLDTSESSIISLSKPAEPMSTQQISTVVPSLATPVPSLNNMVRDPLPPQWITNPAFPLIVGVIPVILIAIGTFLTYRFLKSH